MKYHRFVLLIIVVIGLTLPRTSHAETPDAAFALWLDQFKADALDNGVSRRTLDIAFADIMTPRPEIVARDRRQPEFTQTLDDYLATRVNQSRIETGHLMMRRYPTWLGRVERTYGVQRRFVVALWGIESSYGEHTGTYSVVHALATLAYDNRRGDYFRKELLEALRLIDDGTIPFRRMQGSWAGAMGQCQFMPSSFRRYAVDADSSGSTNIWASVPDVLGSIANYLARAGWKDDQTWGRKVRLPERFDYSLVGLETTLPLPRWQALGVRRSNGRALPRRNLKASLIMPDGQEGPAYLVYDNFRVLLTWNRSNRFAITVGTLSDHFRNR